MTAREQEMDVVVQLQVVAWLSRCVFDSFPADRCHSERPAGQEVAERGAWSPAVHVHPDEGCTYGTLHKRFIPLLSCK